MMFQAPLALKIVRGEKTATRRGVNWENRRSPWARQSASYPVGKIFTINPGRGVTRIAEAEVTGRYMHRLEQVTEAQARAEGFANLAAFREAWAKINPRFSRQMDGALVHVVEFKLHGPECAGCRGSGLRDAGHYTAVECADCFGTGIEVSAAARALERKLAEGGVGAG